MPSETIDPEKYPRCLGGGKYCGLNREIIYEALFEICIHRIYTYNWWGYMKIMAFHLEGVNNHNNLND